MLKNPLTCDIIELSPQYVVLHGFFVAVALFVQLNSSGAKAPVCALYLNAAKAVQQGTAVTHIPGLLSFKSVGGFSMTANTQILLTKGLVRLTLTSEDAAIIAKGLLLATDATPFQHQAGEYALYRAWATAFVAATIAAAGQEHATPQHQSEAADFAEALLSYP